MGIKRKPFTLSDCLVPVSPGNPCGECQRNIRECPWLHSGKPVQGWQAKERSILSHNTGGQRLLKTFAISSCPLYIPPDKKRLAKVTPFYEDRREK